MVIFNPAAAGASDTEWMDSLISDLEQELLLPIAIACVDMGLFCDER